MISGAFINTTDIDTNLNQNNIISTSTEIVSTSTIKKADIQSKVKVAFADAPIMQRVAYCESRNRQFDTDGSIFRGIVNNRDVGVFQINEKYHLSDSKKMGVNIYTVDGNLEYAQFLYKTQGTRPWNSSKPCWGNTDSLAYNR